MLEKDFKAEAPDDGEVLIFVGQKVATEELRSLFVCHLFALFEFALRFVV